VDRYETALPFFGPARLAFSDSEEPALKPADPARRANQWRYGWPRSSYWGMGMSVDFVILFLNFKSHRDIKLDLHKDYALF
jgi:hypothetical protein